MARYGFATLLEEHPVGYEFAAGNIPLHLTHVDSFEVNLNADELAHKLQQALTGQKSFKVRAISDTLLGPDKNMPVTILEPTPQLAELHRRIMDMLEAEGAILKNPHFHRDLYSPHVSIYDKRRINVGEEVLIKDISVGIKTGDDANALHKIVSTVGLSQDSTDSPEPI